VLRVGLPSFIAGFLACVWLNVANKPPPVVVQKLVRKKKPKLTIEEIPDDDEPARDGEEETGGDGTSEREARPGEEMKMVLVVNDALGMSAGGAPHPNPEKQNLTTTYSISASGFWTWTTICTSWVPDMGALMFRSVTEKCGEQGSHDDDDGEDE